MNNVKSGLKNIKVKFCDEVENTQSSKEWKLNPSDGMPTDPFASNILQEVNGVHLYQKYDDTNNSAVITLYCCDINPTGLLNICQKTKVLKNPLTLFFDTGAR